MAPAPRGAGAMGVLASVLPMAYGLWPMAYGLWPVACGLCLWPVAC